MRPIRFRINIEAVDCYIYFGRIFFVLEDGIYSLPLWKLFASLKESEPDFKDFIICAFERNDYINGYTSSKHIFGIPGQKENLKKVWEYVAKKRVWQIDWNDIADMSEKVCTTKISDFVDFRFYAGNLFLGEYDSFSKVTLPLESERYDASPVKKIFDSYVCSLNANYGNVVISGGEDGLFSYDVFDLNQLSDHRDSPVPISESEYSRKTGWNGFNLINYTSNCFSLIENRKHVINSDERGYKFNPRFEKREDSTISQFNIRQIAHDRLLRKSQLNLDDILFTFNSSTSGYFYMKDGSVRIKSMQTKDDDFYFSSKGSAIPDLKDGKAIRSPLSGCVIPKGMVLEFIDQVLIVQDGETFTVPFPNGSCSSVRSYLNSKRNQNLITVTTDKYIDIFSLDPFSNDYLRSQIPNVDAKTYTEIDFKTNTTDRIFLPF